MQGVALLGATGSIGLSTLKTLRAHANRFHLVSAAAGRNVEAMAQIIREFSPGYIAMADESAAADLRQRFPGIRIEGGGEAVVNAALLDEADIVLAAIVGEAGLASSLAAARAGKRVALANKESLVMAGPLFRPYMEQIIPVDSEHAALHQALRAGDPLEVRRLILTASGGPFRTRPLESFSTITVGEALNHPTWKMGAKITIDSATMINKALEIIEAHYLFDVDPEWISVLIHPESTIHSMVEFMDGSIIAQIAPNDMTFPIQYALTYPRRLPPTLNHLDLGTLATLHFELPDPKRFPALTLAYQALKAGESAPAVLSAANEEAVAAFLDEKISFPAIVDVVRRVFEILPVVGLSTLEEVIEVAGQARRRAREEIERAAKGLSLS